MPARPRKAAVTKPDFKSLLNSARLPERTVEVCLRGDLVADHEAAERDLEQAQKTPTDSLAGTGVGEAIDRIEALEAQMRDASVTFRLRGLPRPKWRELLAAHPPRRGEDGEIVEDDRGQELNVETFYDDLIRACLVEPDLSTDDWAQLLEVLTDRQYGDLAGAAWLLNRGDIDVPFSHAASRMRRSTAAE